MRVAVLVAALLAASFPAVTSAQYGETARPLPVPLLSFGGVPTPGVIHGAVQVGRRLFVGGMFSALAPAPTGVTVHDPTGQLLPGSFPDVSGTVFDVASDGAGGWVLVGDFTRIGDQAVSRLARITPQRAVDPSLRVVADGAIIRVAVAHGRLYLAGRFTTINGLPRRGLAALDLSTGQLSSWGAGFDNGGRPIVGMSVSSLGVYVSAWPVGPSPAQPRLWGLAAASGQVLFARSIFVSSLAASAARVYVGTGGADRPLYAIDPFTGVDSDWRVDARFQPLQSTTGDYTNVATMLLDGSRLYIGGALREAGGRTALMAVDTTTGTLTPFRLTSPAQSPSLLARIGPALVVVEGQGTVRALDPASGAVVPFAPTVTGLITSLASAPEGLLVGGSMQTSAGEPREKIAAIDLDTGVVSPWTSSFTLLQPYHRVYGLATDGTWLFVAADFKIAKIDPVTGLVAAEVAVAGVQPLMHRLGNTLLVSWYESTFNGGATRLGSIDTATFTLTPWSTVIAGTGFGLTDIAADGDVVYIAGGFNAVDGQPRAGLAALRQSTHALLPWSPQVDDGLRNVGVEASAGRIWIAGDFRRVGGAQRRGLAELDPITGAALAWNPDVPGVVWPTVQAEADVVQVLRLGPDGRLYAALSRYTQGRPTAAGQATSRLIAYDVTTGRRVPWRHDESGLVDVVADCVLVEHGCMPRMPAPPSALQVTQAAGETRLAWTPSTAPGVTGVRLELGSREGAADFGVLDFSLATSDVHAPVPPGRYVARVRSLVGGAAGPPSADVSFAVGAPAAPLDITATVDGTRVTFNWLPPSTGAPSGYVLEAGSREDLADLAAVPLPGSATTFSAVVPPFRYWARLRAVDARGRSAPSGELLLAMEPADTCAIEPRAPLAFTAVVTGSTVTFRWQLDASGPPPDALRLIAGVTPGGSDVTLDLAVGASSYSVAAPPGTYYARLVATNACGTSAPTAPVTVVVP